MIAQEPPAVIVDEVRNPCIEKGGLDVFSAHLREEETTEEVPTAGIIPEKADTDTLRRALGADVDELAADLVIDEDELFEVDTHRRLPTRREHVFPKGGVSIV